MNWAMMFMRGNAFVENWAELVQDTLDKAADPDATVSGPAQQSPYYVTDWNAFLTKVKSVFGDKNEAATARNELQALKMNKDETVRSFYLLSRSHFSRSFLFQVPPLLLMISRPYPYSYTPTTIHSFLLLYFPFHTSQEQDETAHGLHLTIRYWYMRIDIAIVREPSPTRSTRPTLLIRTREPRHLRTPTTGLAMGQDLRNQEGDPPPRPTEEPTSRESNRPPARNRSSDSQ